MDWHFLKILSQIVLILIRSIKSNNNPITLSFSLAAMFLQLLLSVSNRMCSKDSEGCVNTSYNQPQLSIVERPNSAQTCVLDIELCWWDFVISILRPCCFTGSFLQFICSGFHDSKIWMSGFCFTDLVFSFCLVCKQPAAGRQAP